MTENSTRKNPEEAFKKPTAEEEIEMMGEYLNLTSELLDLMLQKIQPGVRVFSYNYYKNNRDSIQASIKKAQQSRIVIPRN